LSKQVKEILIGRNKSNIKYLGVQKPIEPILLLSDILVVPTHREGFGNVFIEAGAMRKPVITCRVTGAKDAVVDGHTGMLTEKENVNELINAMRFVYLNRKEAIKMGENNYENVKDNYNREHFLQYYFSLYQSLI